MGEVFRARDTRLDRTVAIKILPAALAADPQFRERFDREARAISQLTHPHICTLYDVGEQAGTAYLVMELLEGETLADRLARGALPLDQALAIATQIASALDKAHRAGITHRDLKPGNIMLTKTGAKLLDFGLAKTAAPAVTSTVTSMAPTTPPNLTAQGAIIGTFQYMAPEQLEGQEADARTDIFSFGAVLYEMLTGSKAFDGKSQVTLIAAIIGTNPPPIAASQPLAPPWLDHIVRRCLAKNPDERWQNASDLHDVLTWNADITARPAATSAGVHRRVSARERVAWTVALLGTAAAIALGVAQARREVAPVAPSARFSVASPEETSFWANSGFTPMAISPDGTRMIFAASGDGPARLWVRRLDSLEATPLEGTEITQAADVFWSPDSRSIGFQQRATIKRVDVDGGALRTIAAVGFGGATWNRNGTIVFGQGAQGLFRVSAEGGELVQVTKPDASRGEQHRFPFFLPDGRQFLYTVTSASPDARGIYLGSLDSTTRTRLLDVVSRAMYAPSGHLLYVRDGTLLARAFDLGALELNGDSLSIAEGLAFNPDDGNAAFSISSNGLLLYRSRLSGATQLTWVDRAGRQLGPLGPQGEYLNPTLSPDGTRVAVDRTVSGNRDVWLIETARGIASRLTFDPGPDFEPVWSPDGGRLMFASIRQGAAGLYQKVTSGGDDELLFKPTSAGALFDVSGDGQFLVYQLSSPVDLWVLPLGGDRKPFPFLETQVFQETHAQVSPDGRWLTYVSNESGSDEIYVDRFPTRGAKQQVSAGGGVQPRWRRDGKELYYLAPGLKLTTVPVSGNDALTFGSPAELFTAAVFGGLDRAPRFRHQYDVTPDGQRFLINVSATTGTAASPVTVLVNWTAALNK